MTIVRLTLRPHIERGGFHTDRFDAHLGDELIATSRQPLLDGARALMARDHDPAALLAIRHVGKDYDSFEPPLPIGDLARWTIEESNRRGMQRRRWRSFEGVASPVAEAA